MTASANMMALHIEPKVRRAERTASANMMALHIEPKVRRVEKTAIRKYANVIKYHQIYK